MHQAALNARDPARLIRLSGLPGLMWSASSPVSSLTANPAEAIKSRKRSVLLLLSDVPGKPVCTDS
jgi:hypothetical protein